MRVSLTGGFDLYDAMTMCDYVYVSVLYCDGICNGVFKKNKKILP
jgi:hypothetical protein